MAGRHDQAQRRAAKRRGRETGCWVYIPGEQLARLGIDRADWPLYYRTFPGPARKNPGLVVQLYLDP